jgi:pimeloyl-ACP methyl ester carboxylesterase
MLHCIGCAYRIWDRVVALLRRFGLMSYDLPGPGETAEPGCPYEIENLSELLAAMLTSVRVTRAHLVGNSLGGIVARISPPPGPSTSIVWVQATLPPR